MTFSIAAAAKAAKKAARGYSSLGSQAKNALLTEIAEQLIEQKEQILIANQKDLDAAQENQIDASMQDRLRLNEARLKAIRDAVLEIVQQPDPVGEISHVQQRPSGIRVGKMRIPLGVIAMIYESRPNVTIDAAALCLKAGNGVILRGGKEAIHSNLALAKCIQVALEKHQLDPNVVVVVPNTDRNVMNELMTLNDSIDLIIPRGGEGLIRFVTENSRIPVIQHFKGVCHLYIDKQADLQKGLSILENGKTQRTSVCNSLETLLVHQSVAETFLPMAAAMFNNKGVKVHACNNSIRYFHEAEAATEDDWHAEYLALEIAVRVVDDFDHAVEHIGLYGSGHTEVIVTQDYSAANEFIRVVDSAVVMANASSRFSDGGELGLGAEIGISTSKLHAYGPMGATSLTTEKFVVYGDGETRG
ncbi:glutamate-5-semialdehyde dehydrogenase [Aliiglaciecola lipolytica]|uniref:Gamma-glutamyl phosphate reductase n=1 Tax=Aliiglaciecola lipolytica E3 TaxID=1127673 RepID=K6X6N5_9ALTE|nr:glutamate-5-semialdehyde dehydrogenase [Aliiglaciecola lipolytica]GAC16274.1 glutamate-5-semialdehyde dehydrogenase [Aliiglaciecola lipolytica E3]